MNIPNGVIFIWTGNNADIPTGWERVTDLDNKYTKGTADSTDPNDTGGSATHTHTSNPHSHTMADHTHNITIGNGTGAGDDSNGTNGALSTHNHGAAFASGVPSSVVVENILDIYGAYSSDPPYKTVIFITPSVAQNKLPEDTIGFCTTEDIPLGFSFCNGTGTTDLRNKYLKGADTDADAGTSGGSLTNAHDISHEHDVSHTHVQALSGTPSALAGAGGAGSTHSGNSHRHYIIPASATDGTADTSITSTDTTNVEPAYIKLNAIQNTSGIPFLTVGIIGMWLGTLANIPNNWTLCDGNHDTLDTRGKHIKCSNVWADKGSLGGSNTHTHGAENHTHAAVSHTHTIANFSHTAVANALDSSGTGQTNTRIANEHQSNSATTVNYTLNNTSVSALSANNEPPYRTVAFIKLTKIITAGGQFLVNFI